MRKKIKGNFKPSITPQDTVKNKKDPGTYERLTFDFSYDRWLKSISIKGFTNLLKNEEEFASAIVQVFKDVIPIIQSNWEIIRHNTKLQFPHCHSLAKDKIILVNKIIEEIYNKQLMDESGNENLNYWQLGVKQSLRLIAIFDHSTNIIYPVFLDHFHQIHPSIKHNDNNINKNTLCAYTKYSG
ncbi:hypothetical protein GZH47_22700 [Paenibacillus rhizovicinus]|uniref:Uncharacterized protein n=1 Tax=Paenibacillus rhizovicinus TaxID=2704463 RepID=A0A6C0P462_9BACL|nr:hypothetical protein [Paenibacillus rhizovicinus]QHW33324.1 hypothetical protein GZH47_22700 [Paenibacillus rhizovicinus]